MLRTVHVLRAPFSHYAFSVLVTTLKCRVHLKEVVQKLGTFEKGQGFKANEGTVSRCVAIYES